MNRTKHLLPILLLILSLPLQAKDSGLENLRQTSKAFATVAKKVSPSVVFISVEKTVEPAARLQRPGPFQQRPNPFGEQSPFGDDFLRHFFGGQLPQGPDTQNRQPSISGQGSGFVFAAEDSASFGKQYILTNNHVIEGASKITVQFENGEEFPATITGTDPQSDVAVIEIENENIPALETGDSNDLEVGEWVIAVGNPFGLNHTLTVGVVSAKGRSSLGINDYEDFIQTDAAINPGNSGGPLVNLDGEVIGINTAIFTRSGGYMGVGFAIPISLAESIANQLIDQGEVTRGFLGVTIQALTKDLANSFGRDVTTGILISQVNDGTPADRAGLKSGDIIVQFDGKDVLSVGGFRNRVALTPPGNKSVITVIRAGMEKEVSVTIGNLDGNINVSQTATQSTEAIGLSVQTLTKELARQFNTGENEGVVVTDVKRSSAAERAGIQVGNVILQVGQTPISTADEFRREVSAKNKDKRMLLLVKSGENQRFVSLSW